MKKDNEAGGSNPILWLKSKIEQSAPIESIKKVTRKELEEKIASLETIIKRDRRPPKEREVWPESNSSTEAARESEKKKQKFQDGATEGSSTDVGMVYALPSSFKAESIEFEEQPHCGEELTVAQLRLEDIRMADAVVFKKPLALQTSYIIFKKLSKSEDELKPTNITIIDFTGNGPQARGIFTTELTVGSKIFRRAFFVVDADSHYNLLLRRDWIHANECAPSTLQGKLFQWIGDRVEEIMAKGMQQTVDINVEGVSHISWADSDPYHISFVRVTERGVQLVLLKEVNALVATEEPLD
uniref:Uncharacterized protein n=1 Tax=Ananas comosus var. bracteatus TaxID=296719 RepID=A0A6V7Q6W8_ANACO|nr:unnamed protein product [Ananas comosus var. bracteatus]